MISPPVSSVDWGARSDIGLPHIKIDSRGGNSKKDLGVKPDKKITPPDGLPPTKPDVGTGATKPGDSCASRACTAPQVCVAGVCRATCNAPVDPCKAVSNCPSDHGCLQLQPASLGWVCLPANPVGGGCPTPTDYCAINTKCINNGEQNLCYPLCTKKGNKCGSGSLGICTDFGGSCLVCSTL